jgi:hypothetical protein
MKLLLVTPSLCGAATLMYGRSCGSIADAEATDETE